MSRSVLLLALCVLAHASPYIVEFTVQLENGQDTFEVTVHPEWAPLGAARFKELIDINFLSSCRFFRTIAGFMSQFGIPGKPEVAAEWRDKKILDDPVVGSNKRGFLSFATSGKDSRTTQMFINLADNANLDGMGFSPFAEVTKGMDVVDKIYSGYGEGGAGDGSDGKGPAQGRVQSDGNKYLKRVFPRLSYIVSTRAVPDGEKQEL